MSEHVDVLIVGGGLSGIGTAVHLSRGRPGTTYALLERREALGGTWDLFRYPGVRSDSDMTSFGFRFKPWMSTKVLADGPSIREYVRETAEEFGVRDHVRFGLRVDRARWSTPEQRWTVEAVHEATGEARTWTCRFLVNCTGYYDYDEPHRPTFDGEERFGGRIVHPQFWPEDLDHAGKRVVVIGSGATAVTLVPAMAGTAAHVTMLQRSPTYVFPLPDTEALGPLLERFLPQRWVFEIVRGRNLLLQRAIYLASRRFPAAMRRFFLWLVRRQVGDHVDMRHFTPSYMPWDERLCAAPDGDLFRALRDGTASMATDTIDTFTESGVRLSSGEELPADIVVTATGLKLQALGGMELVVDGQVQDLSQRMAYKSVMIEGLPNFFWVFGYTNAPWTLKSDIAGQYLVRLLGHMDDHDLAVAVPTDPGEHRVEGNVFGALQSGYVQRSAHLLPRQGRAAPWETTHHYGRDKRLLLEGEVDDGHLRFTAAAARHDVGAASAG